MTQNLHDQVDGNDDDDGDDDAVVRMMIYCDYGDNDHMKTMTTMLILRETISRTMMMAPMTSMLMIVN